MIYDLIPGQESIKKHLQKSISTGRIAHAQIFSGHEGSGTLAMAWAYAADLLSIDSKDPALTKKRVLNLTHPDLHFIFPVSTTDKIKKHPISDLFLEEWRDFLNENPFGNYIDWLKAIGASKKQAQIGVDEAEDLNKKMLLKAYEGGFKVVIIWEAHLMNNTASNKLLKLIEEPPKNTVFILITDAYERIINTVLSRCQLVEFQSFNSIQIKGFLEKEYPNVDKNKIEIAAQEAHGDLNLAIHLLKDPKDFNLYESWFVTWVRSAFKAKGNPAVIDDLIVWSEEIAASGKENQKQFLLYSLELFRQAMMLNYGLDQLRYMSTNHTGFKLVKLAPYIHSGNIEAIKMELNQAIYHIERNGNAKLILLDTSIKLTRYLHQKELV